MLATPEMLMFFASRIPNPDLATAMEVLSTGKPELSFMVLTGSQKNCRGKSLPFCRKRTSRRRRSLRSRSSKRCDTSMHSLPYASVYMKHSRRTSVITRFPPAERHFRYLMSLKSICRLPMRTLSRSCMLSTFDLRMSRQCDLSRQRCSMSSNLGAIRSLRRMAWRASIPFYMNTS